MSARRPDIKLPWDWARSARCPSACLSYPSAFHLVAQRATPLTRHVIWAHAWFMRSFPYPGSATAIGAMPGYPFSRRWSAASLPPSPPRRWVEDFITSSDTSAPIVGQALCSPLQHRRSGFVMRIGVPKEVKGDEYRVGMMPVGAET